jgi:hypothetical protein
MTHEQIKAQLKILEEVLYRIFDPPGAGCTVSNLIYDIEGKFIEKYQDENYPGDKERDSFVVDGVLDHISEFARPTTHYYY